MNKIRTNILKGFFMLISTLVLLSIFDVIGYFILSNQKETFWNYSVEFMKYGVYIIGYLLVTFGFVFVFMNYITKLYKRFFPN